MKTNSGRALAYLCLAAVLLSVWTLPVAAQTAGAGEKPRLYTYAAYWTIPRGRWDEMAKAGTSNQKIFDTALSNGTIVGYGNEETLVHQVDGPTHVNWWAATSQAGLFNVLDQIYRSKSVVAPVFASATRHWDSIYVSRFYELHSGSLKGAYVHGSSFKRKPDAPDNAVEIFSKYFAEPLLQKLMADGTVFAYQIAEEVVHTEDPAMFYLFYITPKAEGFDKVNAALREVFGANSLVGPAFALMMDYAVHRDSASYGDFTLR
jgi:hypothetical protein